MLTFGYFLAKTADLLAPALKRGSATDDAGNVFPVNAEHPDQRAVLLAALAPLAGKVGLGASGKAVVAGQLVAAGQSPVFTPIAGRPMNLICSGGAGIAAQLERSFDNGATWYVKISDALRAVTPETFTDTETEVGVQYRWNVTAIGSGTVTLRISQ